MRRAIASLIIVGVAVTPLAGARASSSAQADWRAQVSELLERRAAAVRANDEPAFMATMAGAPEAFRVDRRTWFRRMQVLPIGRYALLLAPHSYDDLSPALARRPAGDDVHVVEVIEQIGFTGYDRRPAQESLFLTVVRRGQRWHVHSDSDLDDLGLLSARSMWDFAPVERVERGGVMVFHQSSASSAERILSSTLDAIGRVRRSWPLPWRARVIVMIPRSARDLQRILATTIDLGPFVAFAASSVERDARGGYALVGSRIFVQPDTFFGYAESFQDDTLGHEMLHFATRHLAGGWTTSWLEEGVAQVYGERSFPALAELRAQASRVRGLPDDHRFFIGSRDSIHLSYEASAHFTAFLQDRYDDEEIARFYEAVGAESPVSFGTDRYHLDRAARATLDVGFDALERRWVERVREEFS